MYKCQNNETKIVLDYFKGFKGSVLDIGANDGETFSNSYDLIKLGWKAHLFEPSSVYFDMVSLYHDNPKVKTYNLGLGGFTRDLPFYESGCHVKNGSDKALVSSTDKKETERWLKNGVEFKEKEISVIGFNEWYSSVNYSALDFISVDVEGMELEILQEINLTEVGCKCLCIEWNSKPLLAKQFTEYCNQFGLKEIHRNDENLIFAL